MLEWSLDAYSRYVAPGVWETDACRYDQALVCDYPRGEYYDAIRKQICNIKPGTKYGDALVFEQALRIENNELYLDRLKQNWNFILMNQMAIRCVYFFKVRNKIN